MQDDCQTATIHVRDWNSSTTTSNPVDIISLDNTWSGNNPRFGGTALWSAKRAYAYFLNEHSRASWDDADGAMDIYINAVFLNSAGNTYTDNASMSATGGTMKVGLGSSGTLENSWSTLDMISHEYAHAVTSASANLVYQGESGALNESFSDIFGEMSEAYTFGGCDYLVGEERTNGAIRSLSDPNSKNDPDTYGGVHWASTSGGDNGGVHTNSGVQNYWFHLLANGGSGTNDNGDAYSVSGIGRLPARDISYRSLTTYLISSDQYADAREGAIRAATDLYGSCSNEEIQTGKAWYAVGVGTGLALYDHVICGTVNTGIRQGINSVVGGGGCSNDASPTVGNVIYKAGTSFTFKPGFTATASGTRSFVTQMDPCSFAAW
jgi:Zn-dependent metalloprotease